MSMVVMEIVGQTNKRSVTAGVQALSAYNIMLIRPSQVLPLVRSYMKLFIFKNIFKCKASLHPNVTYFRKKKKILRIFSKFKFLVGTST